MPEQKLYTFPIEVKADDDAPPRSFTSHFSTFNVIDHDGDVTLPGAFGEGAKALVGQYNHSMNGLPVGKGAIRETDEGAKFDGVFFDTPDGNAHHATVKAAGELMEWSYVFRVTDAEMGEWTDADGAKRRVRLIKSVDVWSVDPVLKGAGIGTRTDSIKSRTGDDAEPVPFLEDATATVATVTRFVERAEARAEMRARSERKLSADDRAELGSLATALDELKARLADVLEVPGESSQNGDGLYLEHLALLSEFGLEAVGAE